MSKKTLEDAVRGVLTEQYKPLQQWEKEKKPSIDIGGHAHDPSGPNKAHIEEDEQLDEITGTATSFGGRHNPRRSAAKYLAGKRLKTRASLQASGNQRRKPGVYEEVKEKFLKKLSEKQSEKALGKTATGQQGETIDIEPTNQELTGPTR
jgi:hypothetical protein